MANTKLETEAVTKTAVTKAAVTKAAVTKADAAPQEKHEEALSAEKKAAATKANRKSGAEKKTAVKRTAVKRTAKKPGVSKAMKSNIFIEFDGRQIAANDIMTAAVNDFGSRNKGVTVKSLEIYVKPEENTAYYVVNGDGCDQYKVNL